MSAALLSRLPPGELRTAKPARSRSAQSRSARRPRAVPKSPATTGACGLTEPISYVPHPVFRRADAERQLARLAPLPDLDPPAGVCAEPGLTFVAGFVSLPLLTAAEEKALFAWMNFARFRAETLRRRGAADTAFRTRAARIRQDLARAHRLRNRIVASNLRLVVSLAKNLSRSVDQQADLIGEGVVPLIRAVELFDISLGNRFSTYATWAVRNQMLRSLRKAKVSAAGVAQAPEGLLDSLPVRDSESCVAPGTLSAAAHVERMLCGLPDRDQRVLCARFGLAGEPAGQSLADVARRVGLSKERVRQIVLKSLEELRRKFRDPRDVS